MFGLSSELTILLFFCLLVALSFAFINGFHDTANAVATVIYTHSLKPLQAVIWSGVWNFIGVFVGGVAVAMGIVSLLPLDALVDQNVWYNLAMILAIILTAVVWNFFTWWLGIPCSSTHALIGSIFGVGLAFMFLPDVGSIGLNTSKVEDVGMSLLISPFLGFGLALLLMTFLRNLSKDKKAFKAAPKGNTPPPFWTRILLILCCTSVSFSHGSNDGQVGGGLIMIILITLAPSYFALDKSQDPRLLMESTHKIEIAIKTIDSSKMNVESQISYHVLKVKLADIEKKLTNVTSFDQVPQTAFLTLRTDINAVQKLTGNLLKTASPLINSNARQEMKESVRNLKSGVDYIPWWVIVMISLALGIGTMVGWKNIVVTIGEKIGKTPLTYAQGASAQLVATATILSSSSIGLPVSTTHVLSSGVAGTMVAQGGLKNLRKKTVRSILIAWFVTLPITILCAGLLFLLLRWIFSLFVV